MSLSVEDSYIPTILTDEYVGLAPTQPAASSFEFTMSAEIWRRAKFGASEQKRVVPLGKNAVRIAPSLSLFLSLSLPLGLVRDQSTCRARINTLPGTFLARTGRREINIHMQGTAYRH